MKADAAVGESVTATLGLYGWELSRPPRMVGDSLDLYLAHPERGDKTLTFRAMAEFTNQRTLGSRLAFECGRRGKPPSQDRIYDAAAVIGELAEQHKVPTDDEIATEHGASWLQRTFALDVEDINAQAQRWDALEYVKQTEDVIEEELKSVYFAGRAGCIRQHAVTLVDVASGCRYVHAGWFFAHARDKGANAGPGALGTAMRRVGWERPASGRLWARDPKGERPRLTMHVWRVPKGWGPADEE